MGAHRTRRGPFSVLLTVLVVLLVLAVVVAAAVVVARRYAGPVLDLIGQVA